MRLLADAAKRGLTLVALAVLCGEGAYVGFGRAQPGPSCTPVSGRGYDVAVRIDVPAPKLDRSQTRAMLGGFAPHGAGQSVLGLMRGKLAVESLATYGHITTAAGTCIWVERVEVKLRYQSLDLFVAKEYAPTSCAYRAILAHEQQHAEIARTYVNRYAPRIRMALASLLIPKAEKPVPAATREAAEARVDGILERLVAPVVAELEQEMGKAQADIDSQRSYQAVQRQCPDW
ncbi:MAG: hypothetical protein EXQ88_05750 [Alphaproteobacteria bacterium]|nr:hypothetical protein [Alphaproteobacteria bacterium]